MYATAALMAKGATVFRNTGCDGKTDLCFQYQGNVYQIDVKIAAWQHNAKDNWSWRAKGASQVRLPVYPLIVVPVTGTDLSGWHCRWLMKKGQGNAKKKSYHCPPGLENFWN